MKNSVRLILLLLVIIFGCTKEPNSRTNNSDKDYTKYVDPFIGTGGHGHTFSGAMVPFGMVQLSPDTRMENWDGSSY